MWTVYKHTSPYGKVYIGITSQNPIDRWGKNGSGYKRNYHLTNAIKKYGWTNFKHEILFTNLTEEEAKAKEIELIAKYDSTNRKKGYNFTLGGDLWYKANKHRIHPKCKLSNITIKCKYYKL